jgi:O-antigen ligase
MKRLLSTLEYLFAISSVILYSGGIFQVILSGGASEGQLSSTGTTDDPNDFLIFKLAYSLNYVISFFLLTRIISKSSKISEVFLRNPFILILNTMALLSITWSVSPEATLSRSISLLGTTLFGIYLANRYTLKEQIILLGRAFSLIILLCFAFVIALPQYGTMAGIHTGAWRGIFFHKNGLGRMMVLSTAIFLIQPHPWSEAVRQNFKFGDRFRRFSAPLISSDQNLIDAKNWRRLFFLALGKYLYISVGILLSLTLLILSKSSGSIVNVIIITAAVFTLQITKLSSRQRFFALLGLLVIIGSLAVIILPDPEIIFAALGKSSDLTGRSDLWNLLIDMLSQNLFLGFGYGAFWDKYHKVLIAYSGWDAPHAHNGFLDLSLSLGIVGLGLFFVSLLFFLSKGLPQFKSSKTNEEIWPLIGVTYIILSNLGETGLVEYNDICWLLFVLNSYSVVPVTKKTILFLPPSREPKPILSLPEARSSQRKYLAASKRRKKPFLALPESRTPDPNNLSEIRRKL